MKYTNNKITPHVILQKRVYSNKPRRNHHHRCVTDLSAPDEITPGLGTSVNNHQSDHLTLSHITTETIE